MLQRLLKKIKLSGSYQAGTGLEARRMLNETTFQLVIVNTPLPDEQGEAVARLAFASGAQVILLSLIHISIKNDCRDLLRQSFSL